MTHPHKERENHPRKYRGLAMQTANSRGSVTSRQRKPKLDVVLKGDSEGSLEAASAAISKIAVAGADVVITHAGLGAVTASDIFLAETAGRLIVGFQVDVLPGIEKTLREHNVEVRLYDVIYTLTADLKVLAEGIVPPVSEEEVTGSARVIALFKSSRKGIITGCEVLEGRLAVGQHFRIISAMGPVYSGTIESLHVGEHAVQTASPGQHVGIKIRNFSGVRVGDMVESYRPGKKYRTWKPAGGIIRK